MKKAACVSAFVLGLAALAAPALAAPVQGELGTNSTGSFDVSVTVDLVEERRVRVSGLSDIDFGVIDEFTIFPISRASGACFYHTSPTFSLTVSGPGGAIPLTITDNQGGSAALSLSVVLDPGGLRSFQTTGGTTTNLIGNTQSDTCLIGGSSIIEASLGSVGFADGVYSTTVTLVMAVE